MVRTSRVCAILGLFSLALSASATDGPLIGPRFSKLDPGVSLLVRQWDAESGDLVGWLPMYNCAMSLHYMAGRRGPFEADGVVALYFWDRDGQVRVSSLPTRFNGRDWLPALRDPNVVTARVRDRADQTTFLITSICFGDRARFLRVKNPGK